MKVLTRELPLCSARKAVVRTYQSRSPSFFPLSLGTALAPGATVDALNLPSDAPLVVIQQEEDNDDDDRLSDYPADPKLRKTHVRTVEFGIKCEWVGCEMKVSLLAVAIWPGLLACLLMCSYTYPYK